MAYTVKAFALEAVNLAPESTLEEILQNVAVIISTPKFSVPLERGLGLSQRFIDKPIPAAQSILCLLYTSPSPRDGLLSRMPSSA